MTSRSVKFWTAYAVILACVFLSYVAATGLVKAPQKPLQCVEVPYKAHERGAQCVRRAK